MDPFLDALKTETAFGFCSRWIPLNRSPVSPSEPGEADNLVLLSLRSFLPYQRIHAGKTWKWTDTLAPPTKDAMGARMDDNARRFVHFRLPVEQLLSSFSLKNGKLMHICYICTWTSRLTHTGGLSSDLPKIHWSLKLATFSCKRINNLFGSH